MKKILLFVVAFGVHPLLFGQDSLSVTDFLATAQRQSSLQYIQQKIDFQQNANYKMSWFDEVELRTETSDFIFRQQEYTLRVQPNTRRQIKAQNQFHQADIQLSQVEWDLAFKKGLEQRYEWLVKMAAVNHELTAKSKLKAIYEDQLAVLKKSTGDLNFKIKDLIRAEEDVQAIEVDILQLLHKKEQLNSELSTFAENLKNVTYRRNTLITNQQIQSLIATKTLNYSNHSALARRQNRINLIEKEKEIEQSEGKNPINYAQIKVGGGNNELFREYVSLGLGLNLPFVGAKRLDLNELEVDAIEEQGEYQSLKSQLEEKQRQLIERIAQLIKEQEFLKNQLQNSQAKFTYEQLLKIDEADPLDILDLKEILTKKENAIQKLDHQILDLFVQWLIASDTIMEKPLKNHLLQTQEVIPLNNLELEPKK